MKKANMQVDKYENKSRQASKQTRMVKQEKKNKAGRWTNQ